MANLILTEIGWEDRVRSLLGVDDAYVSDEDLRKPEVIAVAEAEMVARVPNYASLDSTGVVWLEAATVALCAAIVCPSMKARLPVREQSFHLTRDLVVDWDKRKLELLDDVQSFLYRMNPGDVQYTDRPILWVT